MDEADKTSQALLLSDSFLPRAKTAEADERVTSWMNVLIGNTNQATT